MNRPGGARAPGRCCFLSLAGQRAAAVVGTCDEHETDNREPRDHEGNSDHGVAPFCLQGLAPKSFGHSSERLAPAPGRAPGPRRFRGVRAIFYTTRENWLRPMDSHHDEVINSHPCYFDIMPQCPPSLYELRRDISP